MLDFLMLVVIALFLGLLFINFYFRIKALKLYKTLVNNNVEFSAGHLFNMDKMAAEVFPRYPDQVENIKAFSNHIRYSIKIAMILIVLITIFGGILMYTRNL